MQPDASTILTDDTPNDFYVVGIGASAGGLEALEATFPSMPDDTGMAFVIVTSIARFQEFDGRAVGPAH